MVEILAAEGDLVNERPVIFCSVGNSSVINGFATTIYSLARITGPAMLQVGSVACVGQVCPVHIQPVEGVQQRWVCRTFTVPSSMGTRSGDSKSTCSTHISTPLLYPFGARGTRGRICF